jgi:hypothetical protein
MFHALMVVVQDPEIRPLVELDTKSLEGMLPEIPHWIKNPDFDRVCFFFSSQTLMRFPCHLI